MFAHYIFLYVLVCIDFPVYTQRLTRGQKSVCFVQLILDASSQDSLVTQRRRYGLDDPEFESWHRDVTKSR